MLSPAYDAGDDETLQFTADSINRTRDQTTDRLWNTQTGAAIDGPLLDKQLQQRVGIMSYKRARNMFHPDSQQLQHSVCQQVTAQGAFRVLRVQSQRMKSWSIGNAATMG
jgi:hypothetical protein